MSTKRLLGLDIPLFSESDFNNMAEVNQMQTFSGNL